MTQTLAVIIYLIFCLLAGFCGIHRRMGFFGTFLISLIITPVLVLFVLILTAPSPSVDRDRDAQRN
jgi:hypothetical protein